MNIYRPSVVRRHVGISEPVCSASGVAGSAVPLTGEDVCLPAAMGVGPEEVTNPRADRAADNGATDTPRGDAADSSAGHAAIRRAALSAGLHATRQAQHRDAQCQYDWYESIWI